MHKHTANKQRSGYAALVTILLLLSFSVLAVSTLTVTTIRRLQFTTDAVEVFRTYYAAESGAEDALLRIFNTTLTYPSLTPYNVTVDGATTTVTIDDSDPENIVVDASTSSADAKRAVEIQLMSQESSVTIAYGLQAGAGGVQFSNSSTVTGDVFSAGDVSGSGTVITGDLTVADGFTRPLASADSQLDTTNIENFATVNGNRDAAQSFSVSGTINLTRVAVYVNTVGSPGDLDLHIVEDDGGAPDNSDLTEQALPATAVPTGGGWVTITLDDPVILTTGSYWIVLDSGSKSSSNYWQWHHDTDGGSGLTGSNWAHNNNPGWVPINNDFSYEVFDGEEGLKAEDITATGIIRANLVIDGTANGSPCPGGDNLSCQDSTETSLEPISDAQIQLWKDAATAGGTCGDPGLPVCNWAGDFTINSGSATLPAMVIPGDLVVSNTGSITLAGTVWVKGDVRLLNSAEVYIDSSYAGQTNNDEVIIVGEELVSASGDITVSNSAELFGAGADDDSFIMLVSLKNDTGINAITVNNNIEGPVLFFAPNSCIRLSNATQASAAVGYCLLLQNSAQVNYESSLSQFSNSSTLSGSTKQVTTWREVE